jgi:hypothetical protein
MSQMMKVGFLGLGKLGLLCALAVDLKGHDVMGYDINPSMLRKEHVPYKRWIGKLFAAVGMPGTLSSNRRRSSPSPRNVSRQSSGAWLRRTRGFRVTI